MLVRQTILYIGVLVLTISIFTLTITTEVQGIGPNYNYRMPADVEAMPLRNSVIDDPIVGSNGDSISACLLIMDENFRLHEWLAYHYHALPLRYLVVAVDPRSQESPEPIFNQFRQELNMTIISWSDQHFMNRAPLPDDATQKQLNMRYQMRQRQFLGACMQHLFEQNKTWTALWDTDEYITYNRFDIVRKHPESNQTVTSPPDMSEPGTILRYLKDYGEQKCVSMARVLIGSKETAGILNETTAQRYPLIDPRRLDTIRFRYRGRFGKKIHGMGKSLLNVAKIPAFPVMVPNPHGPIPHLCPNPWAAVKSSPFYLRHYIGSWEAYSYRGDDSRRGHEKNYEAYVLRATTQSVVYENIVPGWLPAFVQSVGEERATRLMKDVGLDPAYNASDKIDAWRLSQE